MPKIIYQEDNQTNTIIQQNKGSTILAAALQNNIEHYHVCGGKARCTTCRISVLKGKDNLTSLTDAEKKISQDKKWTDDIRLACQAKILGDVTIKKLVVDQTDVDLVRSEGNINIQAKERSLVVMFCDVENFTGFTAKHLHNPYDVIHLLNRYYKEIGEPIFSNRGHIDKYLGDGFLALFGCDDEAPKENGLNAIRASLRMIARLKELNKYLARQFDHQFKIRIGLHYGSVIVGEVGYCANKQLTVIGDVVNIASRIEAANKEFNTQILASKEMIEHIQNEVATEQVFTTQLRGQNRPHTLYEVTGFKQSDTVFLVQSTLEKVFPQLDEFTNQFFKKFYELDPSVKEIFYEIDAKNKKQMVVNMIGFLTQGINRFDVIIPSIKEINERHFGREVKPKYYLIASKALVNVLEDYLGEDFTPEVKQTWIEFYEQIVNFMEADELKNNYT